MATGRWRPRNDRHLQSSTSLAHWCHDSKQSMSNEKLGQIMPAASTSSRVATDAGVRWAGDYLQ